MIEREDKGKVKKDNEMTRKGTRIRKGKKGKEGGTS